jgi:hypothetical protein
MPARITVKAELASLLAKAQTTTEANRAAQRRAEADRREDRKRLEAKKMNESTARARPLEDPVGRNIFTAAMGSGYQVAIGWGGVRTLPGTSTWSGLDSGIRLWSANGLATIDYDLPELPVNFSEGIDGGFPYTNVIQRGVDEFLLPVNGRTLVYCCSVQSASARLARDFNHPTLLPSGDQYTADTDIFCALVSRQTVRALTVPSALSTLMEAANPVAVWTPQTPTGGDVFAGGFFTTDYNWIKDDTRAYTRFTPGSGFSAGVYEVLSADAAVPPPVRIGACQRTGTCTLERVGFDITTQVDAPSPTWRRNPQGDWPRPDGFVLPGFRLLPAWDWGRPAYCRERLLALGFTEGDLTP